MPLRTEFILTLAFVLLGIASMFVSLALVLGLVG